MLCLKKKVGYAPQFLLDQLIEVLRVHDNNL